MKLAEVLVGWKGRLQRLGLLKERLVADAVAMDDALRLVGLVGIGLGFFVGLFLLHPADAGLGVFGALWGPAWPQRVLAVATGAFYICLLAEAVVFLSRRLKSKWR